MKNHNYLAILTLPRGYLSCYSMASMVCQDDTSMSKVSELISNWRKDTSIGHPCLTTEGCFGLMACRPCAANSQVYCQ